MVIPIILHYRNVPRLVNSNLLLDHCRQYLNRESSRGLTFKTIDYSKEISSFLAQLLICNYDAQKQPDRLKVCPSPRRVEEFEKTRKASLGYPERKSEWWLRTLSIQILKPCTASPLSGEFVVQSSPDEQNPRALWSLWDLLPAMAWDTQSISNSLVLFLFLQAALRMSSERRECEDSVRRLASSSDQDGSKRKKPGRLRMTSTLYCNKFGLYEMRNLYILLFTRSSIWLVSIFDAPDNGYNIRKLGRSLSAYVYFVTLLKTKQSSVWSSFHIVDQTIME